MPAGGKLLPSTRLQLEIIASRILDSEALALDGGDEGVPGDNAVVNLK